MSPRTEAAARSRLELIEGDTEGRRREFGRAALRGLGQAPRSLPSRWLYDAVGVELLRRLRREKDQYVIAGERQLLRDRADAVALYFPHAAPTLVEVGVVDAARTGNVVGPLLQRFGALRYVAVGPDRSAVEGPCRELVGAHPGLRATALVGRLEDAVRELRATPGPVALFWPDGGAGDFDRPDCVAVLRGVAAALRPADLLLATFDLRKDPRAVQRPYRDRLFLWKQLHLHVLERLNDEVGADFDLSLFRHRFAYDEPAGRLEHALVVRRQHTVRIGALHLELELMKGEEIRTLTTTRFSPQEIDQAAAAAQLVVHERWYDRDGRVCANLMRAGTA